MAVAILRENLLDIRVALSRTVTLAAISAVSLVVYALGVTLASRSLARQADVAASLVATLLVAVLLGSVRARAERWLQSRLFGSTAGPPAGSELLSTVARHQDTSRSLLDSPGVSIDSRAGRTLSGRQTTATRTYPLVHQGHDVGLLHVGEPCSTPPGAVEDVQVHLAAALWSVHLVDELQQTRRQLVRGREEERLRIRRDLHDGLGPVLATITLQLDSLRRRIPAEDDVGRCLAEDAKADVRHAMVDLRSLVDGLRPPALDQLGLVRAVERCVRSLATEIEIDLDVRDVAVAGPATEVAAYRVVSEALTNVVRHARATRACVELVGEPDGGLLVRVSDDGVGASGATSGGVGLSSMSERPTELGGTFSLEPRPGGGTTVTARFPPEVR
jgi:signal transduction histidine kinase